MRFTDGNLTTQAPLDGKSYAMRGPMRITDLARTPVRGDLADIRLAGRYFVPHYAVGMAHRVVPGSVLRKAARADADFVEQLDGGAQFNVLDISGNWAWGQVGDAGHVGYLPMELLESV